jgi:hypothetical protein
VRRLESLRRADAKVLPRICAVPWEARSARSVDEHMNARLALDAPLVAPTLKEDKLTTAAEPLGGSAAASSAPAAGQAASSTANPAASAAAGNKSLQRRCGGSPGSDDQAESGG